MPETKATPKLVSLPELRARLSRLCFGWKWAEDAIVDLWKLGAPDPNASVCFVCKNLDQCPHIKRWIYPNQFAKWYHELQHKIGYETASVNAFNELTRQMGTMSRFPKRKP